MRLAPRPPGVNGAMGAFPFRYRKISSSGFVRLYRDMSALPAPNEATTINQPPHAALIDEFHDQVPP